MELYKNIIGLGDMKITINGHKIAVFSNIVCKYSDTLKMFKERDGLDKEILINLNPIVDPKYVDFVFCYLYEYNGRITDKEREKLLDRMLEEYLSDECYYRKVAAIGTLCEYLCISSNMMNFDDDLGIDALVSNYRAIKFPLYLLDKHMDDYRSNLMCLCKFYDIRVNQKDERNIFEFAYKDELNIKINESLIPLYDKIFSKKRTIALGATCYFDTDRSNIVTEDVLSAIESCGRVRYIYLDALEFSDIPPPRKYEIWATLVMEADIYMRENYKSMIE
jgi:hypothetical protein